MRSPRLALLCAVAASAFGAGACSSTASAPLPAVARATSTTAATSRGPGPGTAAGVCPLITLDEAAAVLGAPVTATEQDRGVDKACRYRPADPTGGSVYVSLLTATAADFATAAGNLPVAHTAVSGIGDQAVLAAGAGELLVLSGSHLVVVIVVHRGVVFGREAELRTLAAAAISRL